jgi:hypothetical protein
VFEQYLILSEYLRYNCDLKVTEVYGALGVDKWNRAKWEGLVESSDVIVYDFKAYV